MYSPILKAFLNFSFSFLSTILFVTSAFAQDQLNITGHVYDPAGAVVSGASITIKQNGKNIRETKTGNDGTYQIDNLLSGEYQVVVIASGFATQERNITLTTNNSEQRIDFNLQPGNVTESVTINNSEGNYRVGNASSATRLNLPLMEVPQSIQVVPQELIEDQGVIRPAEAVRNVSGVVRKPAYLGLTDSYAVRGFNAPIGLWNGFRRDHYYSFTDISTIERIEVLKGPASVTYGFLEPGGVVNYVTKRPTFDPYYSVELKTGSFGLVRPSLDMSGPLNKSESVRYRLNTAYERAGSFRDHAESKLFSIAPMLDWDVTDKTRFKFQFGYLRSDSVPDRGLYNSMGPIILDLPRDRFLGEPDDKYEVDQYDFAVNVEHQFNDAITLRSGFNNNTFIDYRDNVQVGRLRPDGRTVTRTYSVVESNTKYSTLFNDLNVRFKTGQISHNALLGFDLTRNSAPYTFRRAATTNLDIFNPRYGISRTLPPVLFDVSRAPEAAGLYFQDQIALSDKVKLLAGGRVDFFRYNELDKLTSIKSKLSKRAISPRIGIVYQPIEAISLYTSYSQSFNPNLYAKTVNSVPVDPESGRQVEAGIKTSFWNGKLNPSISIFQINKKNVAVSDPDDPTGTFYIQTGEQKSRGIEFDTTATLVRGLALIASYAYTDAFVSADTTIPVGNRLVNIPRHGASLWGTYEIQEGMLKNVGVGGGFFFVDDRHAALPNTFTIPSYTRFDATLFYRAEKWKLGLNFKNLTDETYYDSQDNLLYPGAPRSVFADLTFRF
jgi:iron complex outermembrane recepter protein